MADFEYVHKADEALTAKELYDRYHTHLPILVYVVQGFYGNREEMVFSTGQVLRLHSVKEQKRALVHDDRKYTLTVPLDYDHEFFIGHDRTKSFKLGQIVKNHKLPVKNVEFADPQVHFDLGDNSTHTFKKLNVIRVYDESYFLANTMAQGVPLEEVLPIPLYLMEVKFSVVVGLRGKGITDGGQARMQQWLSDRVVDKFDFGGAHSDPEMVQLSVKKLKETDNIYENIETNIYYNTNDHGSRSLLGLKSVRRLSDGYPLLDGSDYDECGSLEKSHQPTDDYENFTSPERPPERPPKPIGLKPCVLPPHSPVGLKPSVLPPNSPVGGVLPTRAKHDPHVEAYDSLTQNRQSTVRPFESAAPFSTFQKKGDRPSEGKEEGDAGVGGFPSAPGDRFAPSTPSATFGRRSGSDRCASGGRGGAEGSRPPATTASGAAAVISAARDSSSSVEDLDDHSVYETFEDDQVKMQGQFHDNIYEINPEPESSLLPPSAAAATSSSASPTVSEVMSELSRKLEHQRIKMEKNSAQAKGATHKLENTNLAPNNGATYKLEKTNPAQNNAATSQVPSAQAATQETKKETTTLSMMPPQLKATNKGSASPPSSNRGTPKDSPFGVQLMQTSHSRFYGEVTSQAAETANTSYNVKKGAGSPSVTQPPSGGRKLSMSAQKAPPQTPSAPGPSTASKTPGAGSDSPLGSRQTPEESRSPPGERSTLGERSPPAERSKPAMRGSRSPPPGVSRSPPIGRSSSELAPQTQGGKTTVKPPAIAHKASVSKPITAAKPQIGLKSNQPAANGTEPPVTCPAPAAKPNSDTSEVPLPPDRDHDQGQRQRGGSKSGGTEPVNQDTIYVNQAEMVVVKPTPRSQPDSGSLEKEKGFKPPQLIVRALETVPLPDSNHAASSQGDQIQAMASDTHHWEVENMSIEEVKNVLLQLKLADYVDLFDDTQVDGVLLQGLDKESLMKDFGMKSVEALKLRNFVEKGHLPKTTSTPK